MVNNSEGSDKTNDNGVASSRRMMIPKAMASKTNVSSSSTSSSTLVPLVQDNTALAGTAAVSSSSLVDEFAEFFGNTTRSDYVAPPRITSSNNILGANIENANDISDSNIADLLLDAFQADTFDSIPSQNFSRKSKEFNTVKLSSVYSAVNESSSTEAAGNSLLGGIRNRVGQVRRKQAELRNEQQEGSFKMDLSILEQLEQSTANVLVDSSTKKSSRKPTVRKQAVHSDTPRKVASSAARPSSRKEKVKTSQIKKSSLSSLKSTSSKAPFSITPGILDILGGLEANISNIFSSVSSGGSSGNISNI